MNFSKLGSKGGAIAPELIPKLRNRRTWKHGFSQCGVCKAKLMAYLDKGHSLNDVIEIFRQKRPDIKNHRRFAMNAIRQTTGDGIFDNYIVERGLWTPRNPVIVQGDTADELRHQQKILAARGRFLLEMDRLGAEVV